MRVALLSLALCAACTPAGADPDPDPDPAAAEAGRPGYATQVEAPSPDYRKLLAEPALATGGWVRREATAPMPADAKAIGQLWYDRLERRDALLGAGFAGKGPDGPVSMIDTGMTEAEFDRWTRENGWSVPRHITWSFVPEMTLPPVSDAARDAIRVWPASTARTGGQNQALLQGPVELRDGCFFVGPFGEETTKLAWFHAEIGLDVDEEGYFILRDRVGGRTLARLGEEMSWGGPASALIDEEAEAALHEACGAGEIYVVGSPESSERFMTQYPHLRDPSPPPTPPARD